MQNLSHTDELIHHPHSYYANDIHIYYSFPEISSRIILQKEDGNPTIRLYYPLLFTRNREEKQFIHFRFRGQRQERLTVVDQPPLQQ